MHVKCGKIASIRKYETQGRQDVLKTSFLSVAAEWRSKEGKSLTGLPMYDESMGLQRNGQETLEAERVPKRVRMDQAGGGEITVPIRQIAAPEDGGNETQERVPIPRSSL